MESKTHSLEVSLVEFTARYLWKAIRPFVSRHLSKRCTVCILPETYAPLNELGVCGECEKHARSGPAETRAADPQLKSRLDELLQSHQGKSTGPYDAMVLVSGGKDSAYMLHRVVHEYPDLRLLAVLVDNGFMSAFALKNAEHVLNRFDVPQITIKPKPSFVKKVFRYTLTHLDKQTGYSIVDLMDGFVTFDHAKNLAVHYDIPLILCGLSKVQLESVFGPIELEFPPEQEQASLSEHAAIVLRDVFDDVEMQYWFDGSKWPKEKVPRFVLPFTAWDLDENQILGEVHRLGLISKKRSRPLLTNNALIPVIGMAEVGRFGYCSWEIEFARMIREGKSERAYWLALFEMLEYSTRTGRFINRTVEQTLGRLGLTKQDLGIAPCAG